MCIEFFLSLSYFLILILINLFLAKFLSVSILDINFLKGFLK